MAKKGYKQKGSDGDHRKNKTKKRKGRSYNPGVRSKPKFPPKKK